MTPSAVRAISRNLSLPVHVMPHGDPKDVLSTIIADCLRRQDSGKPLDPQQVIAEYPQFSDELREFFQGEQLLGILIPEVFADETSSTIVGQDQRDTASVASVESTAERHGSDTGLPPGFKRYELQELLGRGAMGAVYRALDTKLNRLVALKIPGFDPVAEPELAQRFIVEARAAASVRHANLCPVYDVGEAEGTPYISMAFIEGEPLSERLASREHPMPAEEAVRIVQQLALGLQVAHANGVIHRDLKPANVMIDSAGSPIVMDFGLARLRDNSNDIRLTQTGTAIGTPAYMSPEQVHAQSDAVGNETDIYSLGVVLFELLTNRIPFEGGIYAVMARIVTDQIPSVREFRPDVDTRLAHICARMTAKEPADRYATMQDVADALSSWLREQSGMASSSGSKDHVSAEPHSSDSIPLRSPGWGRFALSSIRAPRRRLTRRLVYGLFACAFAAGVTLVFRDGTTVHVPDGKTVQFKTNHDGTLKHLEVSDAVAGNQHDDAAHIGNPPAEDSSVATPGMAKIGDVQNELGMTLRRIPAGEYVMGSPDDEHGREADEGPQRPVRISRDFYIQTTPVTQGQWSAVMSSTPWKGQEYVIEGQHIPATYVSHNDAVEFCRVLTEREDKHYRLPTEAEWEYACRAGTSTSYSFGADASLLTKYAWSGANPRHPSPVAQKTPNAFGLYDMHGNVWEWCSDWYDSESYAFALPADPAGPADGRSRVCRGGSWFNPRNSCRSSSRFRWAPDKSLKDLGFRVVMQPDDR